MHPTETRTNLFGEIAITLEPITFKFYVFTNSRGFSFRVPYFNNISVALNNTIYVQCIEEIEKVVKVYLQFYLLKMLDGYTIDFINRKETDTDVEIVCTAFDRETKVPYSYDKAFEAISRFDSPALLSLKGYGFDLSKPCPTLNDALELLHPYKNIAQ